MHGAVHVTPMARIERVVILDIDERKEVCVASWLIVHGWKELVPTEEGRIAFPSAKSAVLMSILGVLDACKGRFDAVLMGFPELVSRLSEQLAPIPVVGISTLEPGVPSHPIRRGDSLDTVYVTASGYSHLHAAVLVRDMYGPGCLPHLYQRVQRLCRETL